MPDQNAQTKTTAPTQALSQSDLLALVCFLAKYQDDLNKMRYELMAMKDGNALRDRLVGQWPVIQGTRNQMNLAKIGQMDFDYKKVAEAVDAILSANK